MSEKVFFHTAHKALWSWLSKHPEMGKEDWPGWENNGGNVRNNIFDCLACEYVGTTVTEDGYTCAGCSDKNKCPLIWPCKTNQLPCLESFYAEWDEQVEHEDEMDKDGRADFAAQIRDLPVREGVVCK